MELTERMIDAPRGFLLGLELGCKKLESMRAHLDRCGYDYSCWPEWAKTETGHITKAGKAVLIYTMMEAARDDIIPLDTGDMGRHGVMHQWLDSCDVTKSTKDS